MELLGLVISAVLALLVVRAFIWPAQPEQRPESTLDPLDRLCAQLSGDPVRDRPTLNRILALGPMVIPAILDEIAGGLRAPDEHEPRRQARLEELVADFGLAAVPPVAELLVRLQPTASLAAPLTRIVHRLGQSGAEAFFRRGLLLPGLVLYLPRLRWAPAAEAAAIGALRDRDGDRVALDRLAGIIATHPQIIEALFERWSPRGRAQLLEWLADWLPLARIHHIERGLRDPSPVVRAAAAQLAGLLSAPELLPALAAQSRDEDVLVRRAATWALAVHVEPSTEAVLLAAARDSDDQVALNAIIGLVGTPDFKAAAASAPRLGLSDLRPDDVLSLVSALDDPRHSTRVVAARLLTPHVAHDPRARERLISMARSEGAHDRVWALDSLSHARDPEAAEILARAISGTLSTDELRRLQVAAQRIGEAVARPLVRRMRGRVDGRLEATLVVLRSQSFLDATAFLLRSLEDIRSGPVEALISATLFAGGSPVRAAIQQSIDAPARGLLAPGLRYLSTFATPDDVPLLIRLFDRHLPLRTVILNLIESQGVAALPALNVRIDAGGEDSLLLALEQRQANLLACEESTDLN